MKRTQITELFANIKKTFVSFFSILMFAALGVGIFLGVSWAGPALEQAANRSFDEGSFHHFQIQYPYGLTNDDMAKLAEVEGVDQVEGARQTFQTIVMDGKDVTVKVQSIGNDIDALTVVEGELPSKGNEIALNSSSAEEYGLSVGDIITFAQSDGATTAADGTASSGSAASATSSSSASAVSGESSSSASAASGESSSSGSAAYDDDDDSSNPLLLTTFKVTALVNSPDYIDYASWTFGVSGTPSGAVHMLAWVLPRDFNASAFQNGYPIVNVVCDELAGLNTYSNEYQEKSDTIKSRITELGDELSTARYDYLHGQAQAKIDEAQAEIDDGKKKVADGEKELKEGRETLERERAEGEAKLASAYQELKNGEAEYYAGLDEYNARKAAYDSVVSEAESAKAEVASLRSRKAQLDDDLAKGKITQKEYDARLDALVSEANSSLSSYEKISGITYVVTRENFDVTMEAAAEALANYRNVPFDLDGETMTLNEAEVKLNEAKAKLDSAWQTIQSGWDEYNAGQAELESKVAEAEQKLADGEKAIEDAKKKIAENEPKLEDAKMQLELMAKYDWTIMSRSSNIGAAEISLFSGVTNNLSISMAALFIIVGLLVSYFAVSRIVREQITQIGTKKALGFRRGEITTSYLWYSGIAVVAGAIIGAIIGYFIVEGIIGGVLGGMFTFGMYPAYFGWGLFLIITLIELLLVLGATYLACRSILKEHAVELLKGPKPPTGKTRFYEKWGIWDKLPLLIQTIVNNCVNDKRRVLSTIVGVAGATALIVTAITLNNDVLKSYDAHYANVYNFNAITYVDYEPDNAIENVEAALKDEGATTAQVLSWRYFFKGSDGELATVSLVVPMDVDAFSQLYHLPLTTGGEADLSQDGAWVSQAMQKHLGVNVGDELTILELDGTTHQVTILGFYEFWLTYHEMVMGRDYYEREFGGIAPNVVLANTGDVAVLDIERDLSDVDGFYSIVDDKAQEYENFETFSGVSGAVVAIYLVLAALMAVVVLLNLNVMFIDEKKRELIVLMINGFSVKDAKHYISYDNIVLTVLGIIVGLVLGCIMGSITVAAVEPSTAVFIKAVDGWAVLIGIIGSALLAIIMGWIALRRIPKFELTDINRF